MKFKKDGKVFETIEEARKSFCLSKYSCGLCGLKNYVSHSGCEIFCNQNIMLSAKLMGFEVIEDEEDKMQLPIDIGSMTLEQAKEYCRKHAEEEASCARACTEDCKLNPLNVCGYNPSVWNLDRLTPEELEICRVLGAKWVTSDEKTGIVELWEEKPTKNPSNGAYYGNNGIHRIACINSQIMISVKPGDCISVEDLL